MPNSTLTAQRNSLENLYRSGSIATPGLKKALEQITEKRFLFLCNCFAFALKLLGFPEIASRLVFSVEHEHDDKGNFLEMSENKVALEINSNGLAQTTWVEANDERLESAVVVAIRVRNNLMPSIVATGCAKYCGLAWSVKDQEAKHTGVTRHEDAY